jgi:hypothetical protein
MSFQANSSFLGLKVFDLTTDNEVAAGEEDQIIVQPPKGKVYQVIAIKATIPSISGATGNHILRFYQDSGESGFRHIEITGADGSLMYISGRDGLVADTEKPEQLNQQFQAMKGSIFCSNDLPLKIKYINNSDTKQDGTRYLESIVKVYKSLL